MYIPQTKTVKIESGEAKTTSLALDGLDTVRWEFEPGVVGKARYIHATSAAFNVSGKPGEATLSYDLSSLTIVTKITIKYYLYLEGGGSSVEVKGTGGDQLELVIDTIGGMQLPPPPDHRPGWGDHQHSHHESRV